MPIFAEYRGANAALGVQINGFEQAYGILVRPSTKDVVKRKVIDNVEAQLLSILRNAGRGDDYDKRWLAANGQEVRGVFNRLDELRAALRQPRSAELEHVERDIRAAYDTMDAVFGDPVMRETLGSACAAAYTVRAAATAATATAVSAFSFLGGPVVGGAVTGGAAFVGGVSVVVARKFGYGAGVAMARPATEKAVRAEFRAPAPA